MTLNDRGSSYKNTRDILGFLTLAAIVLHVGWFLPVRKVLFNLDGKASGRGDLEFIRIDHLGDASTESAWLLQRWILLLDLSLVIGCAALIVFWSYRRAFPKGRVGIREA